MSKELRALSGESDPFAVMVATIREAVAKIETAKDLSTYISRLGARSANLNVQLRTRLITIFISKINELSSDEEEMSGLIDQVNDQLADLDEPRESRFIYK